MHVAAAALEQARAFAGLPHAWACFTTVRSRTADFPCAKLNAVTTGLATCRPESVLGHLAVNRASLDVTLLSLFECRALHTTVSSLSHDIASSSVLATTACFGASTPFAPSRDNAVNRASVLIAVPRFPQIGALVSTVLCMLNNSS